MLAFTWRNCKLLVSSESASVFQPCNTHAFKNSLCWANAAIFQCCPSRNSYRYCTETMKRRLIDWHDISRSAHETEKPWSISTSASLLWLPVTAAVAVSPGSKLPQLNFQRHFSGNAVEQGQLTHRPSFPPWFGKEHKPDEPCTSTKDLPGSVPNVQSWSFMG